jgi:hypothetical protein
VRGSAAGHGPAPRGFDPGGAGGVEEGGGGEALGGEGGSCDGGGVGLVERYCAGGVVGADLEVGSGRGCGRGCGEFGGGHFGMGAGNREFVVLVGFGECGLRVLM